METLKSYLSTDSPYFRLIVGGGAAIATLVILHKTLSGKRGKRVSKVKCPPDTVLLYLFPRGPHAPSISPFPIKLETYLRMAKIPYVTDLTSIMSKKGKIPWMTYNGVDVADSQFCIEHLNSKLQIDMNQHLSKEERAIARSFQVMLEEDAYWCAVFFRWVCYSDMNYALDVFKFSALTRHFIKKHMTRALYSQGVGRHTQEEIEHKLHLDLQALSDFLGTKSFLMGEVPCEEDCAIFGMVTQLVFHQKDPVLGNLVQEKFPNLHSYVLRMKEKFWPDWDEVCKS